MHLGIEVKALAITAARQVSAVRVWGLFEEHSGNMRRSRLRAATSPPEWSKLIIFPLKMKLRVECCSPGGIGQSGKAPSGILYAQDERCSCQVLSAVEAISLCSGLLEVA